MRCVAYVARCLVGGAIACCLSGGAAPVTAQEWPIETVSLTKPAPPTNVAPATAPTATPAKTPTASPAAKKDSCAKVIGTSRTLVTEPGTLPRIGYMQYRTSLPLKDHEVVLTFDDGPIRTYTPRVLDILAANCVKATFFLVGSMAHAYPRLVRRIYNEGHSIGTHSQHHPLTFNRMAKPAIAREVDAGIASVQAAAGDPHAVAPFFRVPGLLRSKTVDSYLAGRSLMVWSADEVADDWHHGITAGQIVRLAMRRIEARDHRGVLLLHDIHPATARALPMLLAQLKAHGYHIVHAIPAGERPKSVPPLPATMVARAHSHETTLGHHRHVKHRAKHRSKNRKVASRRHHRHRTHRRHLAHAQSLSALTHKKQPTHTEARNAQPSSAW